LTPTPGASRRPDGEVDPLGKKGGDSDWYGYCVDDPVNRVDVWGLAVQACKRPNNIYGLGWTGIPHYWLKTGAYESGQAEVGGGIPGQDGNSSRIFVDTEWSNHTGQAEALGSQCWTVPDVDEDCVNNRIKPGTSTGRWAPVANDCAENVADVLKECRQVTQ